MASSRPFVAALAAALMGVGTAGAAHAQSRPQAERVQSRVQVESVDVEQVERLAPGVPLNFSVYGTQGAAARLRIDGARGVVDLQETQPGIYEGSYVIGPQDRIRADSRVTATLFRGSAVAESTLEESLQLGQGDVAPMHGAARPVPTERMEAVERTERVERGAAVPPSGGRSVRSACERCGIVESVRAVPGAAGSGNLGAVSGALIGAVLGQEAREAHMRRIARIHGTVTGALTGGRAEGDAATRYEVRFRMPNGRTESRSYPDSPAFQVGDRVSLDAAAPGPADPTSLRP